MLFSRISGKLLKPQQKMVKENRIVNQFLKNFQTFIKISKKKSKNLFV